MKLLYKLTLLLSLSIFTLNASDARGGRGGFSRGSSFSKSSPSQGTYSKPSWFSRKHNPQQNNPSQNNYYNNNPSNNSWWKWFFLGGMFGYGSHSYADNKQTEIIDCADEKYNSEKSKDYKKECKDKDDKEKKQEINIHDQLRTM